MGCNIYLKTQLHEAVIVRGIGVDDFDVKGFVHDAVQEKLKREAKQD